MVLAREWSRRHGKFYGVFHGPVPKYVVNDAELLRQISIKDFDAMPNHYTDELVNHYQRDWIFFAQDDHWKRLRVLQTPTFTSGKIKRMFRLLDECANDLVLCFSEQLSATTSNDPTPAAGGKTMVNLKDTYSLYTMDAITSAAYAIKLKRQTGEDVRLSSSRNEFVRLAMRLFEISKLRILIRFLVPVKLLKLAGFGLNPLYYYKDIADRVRPIVDQRRKSNKRHDDYLQILVDASLDDRLELNELDEKENHHAGLSAASLQEERAKMSADIGDRSSNDADHDSQTQVAKIRLTDHEIISSAIFLLMVGIETTATLLSNCTYALAFHLDIQERLYETVKAMAKRDELTGEHVFDYDELTSCEYLDAVVSETLRLLSPVIELDRAVSRDYYVEKYGVQLRKGDKLQLGFYAIMNDPDYWPQPDRFDPERFMGENKKRIVPGSYCPFGLGPRHCLGMRFSLTEAKLGLAKVLMRFKFTPAPGTRFPPECGLTFALNVLKSPVAEMSPRAG
jgi:cytochrome P450